MEHKNIRLIFDLLQQELWLDEDVFLYILLCFPSSNVVLHRIRKKCIVSFQCSMLANFVIFEDKLHAKKLSSMSIQF